MRPAAGVHAPGSRVIVPPTAGADGDSDGGVVLVAAAAPWLIETRVVAVPIW